MASAGTPGAVSEEHSRKTAIHAGCGQGRTSTCWHVVDAPIDGGCRPLRPCAAAGGSSAMCSSRRRVALALGRETARAVLSVQDTAAARKNDSQPTHGSGAGSRRFWPRIIVDEP